MIRATLNIIREATRAVPAVRYALGVSGVMAAFALGVFFFQDARTAFFATLAMFVLMLLLVVFARAATQGASKVQGPATVLVWAMTLLFIAASGLTVSSVFFDLPKPFKALVADLWASPHPGPADPAPKVPDRAPKPVVYRSCRHPDFGQEGWARSETVDQSSGWRDGGSSPQNWCNELANGFIQARSIGNQHLVEVLDKGESNDRDWKGHVTYNYRCSIRISWEPVYIEKQDPRCGLAD